jgi:ankyrin repeat protein
MLNIGIQVNGRVDVPENLHEKYTLFHRATYYSQMVFVSLLVKRGVGIKIRDANNNIALHLAAAP